MRLAPMLVALCSTSAAQADPALAQPARAPVPPWELALEWLAEREAQLSQDLERAHAALLARARREDTRLADKLSPVPPAPRPRGYQVLPELQPDVEERGVELWTRRYALEDTTRDFLLDFRDASLLARRAEHLPAEPLAPLVERFDWLRQRFRFLEQLVAYHRFWQRAVTDDPSPFVARQPVVVQARQLQELVHTSGDAARILALRTAIEDAVAPFTPTPGLRLERGPDGSLALPVVVVTDIADAQFLAAFARAVEQAFATSAAATEQRFRVVLRFEHMAPGALYPDGAPPAGQEIDAQSHLARFPAGALVLTTGARSTHAFTGRAILLGADPMRTRALAHEFGHLLGFVDAYLRGIEGSASDPFGCVLVEWGGLSDSLMGAPDCGRVTREMILRLIRAYSP